MELVMSENINELAKALAAAQGTMCTAKKDNMNPYFNHKYADLASCWDVCRKPLADNGLSIIQIPGAYDDTARKIKITTMLCHSSGQYIKGEIEILVKNPDAQGIGSAITYGRRYSLCAMVGVSQDDDDANQACGIDTQKQQIQPKQKMQCKQPPPQPVKQTQPATNSRPIEKQPEVVTSVHNDGNVRFVNGNQCQVRNTEGQYLDVESLSLSAVQYLLTDETFKAAHEALNAVLQAREVVQEAIQSKKKVQK